MTLPLSQIEGKYEILHKIKDGGMGAVYKVRHRLLEEVRVIKTIRPQYADDPELQERFRREAKTAIRLRHPRIAQLYDFSIDAEGTAYIVMEFIDGVTLHELLSQGGAPPIPLSLELTRQALEALEFLHRKGFVHRDVAPDNLMVARGVDGSPQVKLIDLGIVKRLESAGVDLTATGTFLGKVRYAAPEQFSDASGAGVGPWSDVYSFGVMLYELLTGRLPYEGRNMHELMAGHLFRPPIPFEQSDPEGRIPPELREVVLHALAKQPKERIESAAALAERLAPAGTTMGEDAADLRAELEKALRTATTRTRKAGENPTSGSTRNRVAEQFGLESTPTPAAPRATSRPRRIETRAEEIAKRMTEARRLANEEELHRAKEELDGVLELDPRTEEAEQLLHSVETAIAERDQAARRRAEEVVRERAAAEARAVEDAAASIAGRVADGDFDRAEAELEFARKTYGERSELSVLADRIVRVREATRPPVEPGEAPAVAEPPEAPDDPGAVAEGAAGRRARRPKLAAALAGFLLIAVLAWALSGGDAGDTAGGALAGHLVLDAVPWAEVTEIRDADGDPMPLAPSSYTPLRLSLPPGDYTVTMIHPRTPEPITVAARVGAGESVERSVQVAAVDVEGYFQRMGR